MANQATRLIALTIVWNSGKQTFTVLDEEGEILNQSPDHAKAVALAVKDAKILRQLGIRASVFSKRPDGKIRREWIDSADVRKQGAAS